MIMYNKVHSKTNILRIFIEKGAFWLCFSFALHGALGSVVTKISSICFIWNQQNQKLININLYITVWSFTDRHLKFNSLTKWQTIKCNVYQCSTKMFFFLYKKAQIRNSKKSSVKEKKCLSFHFFFKSRKKCQLLIYWQYRLLKHYLQMHCFLKSFKLPSMAISSIETLN